MIEESVGGPGASRTEISNILSIALHPEFPVPHTEKMLELSWWEGTHGRVLLSPSRCSCSSTVE